MLTLYKSLVRPSLDYCIQVWKPYMQKDVLLLEKVQKRFTKMVEGCKGIQYESRMNKLGITTIAERHTRADMIQAYKIINDKRKIFSAHFHVFSGRKGRKNSIQLFKRRCNLELRRHSFTVRIVDQWNNLPDEVILSKDAETFKCKFDYYRRNVRGHP